MSDRINLADPSFEPTDEQLLTLTKRAFAYIPAANAAARKALHDEIETGRAELLLKLAARKPAT